MYALLCTALVLALVPRAPQLLGLNQFHSSNLLNCKLLPCTKSNCGSAFRCSRDELSDELFSVSYYILSVAPSRSLTRVLRSSQLRRERIAERMKALQELVPNANKVLQISISFLLPLPLSFEQSSKKLSLKCGDDAFLPLFLLLLLCTSVSFFFLSLSP
jgi:hypothetical protein